jgi:excisionase family DNA binding protein
MSATDHLAREIGDRILEQLRAAAPGKELYTLPEAAEFLACSENKVRALVESGKLRRVMIDARPRFRRQHLVRLVEAATE